MKWTGAILVALFVAVLFAVWYDPVEGPPMRAFCYLAIGAGAFLFFEGLKREIIAALREHAKGK